MKRSIVAIFLMMCFESAYAGGIRVGDVSSKKICINQGTLEETCYNPKLTVEKLEYCVRSYNEYGEADWTCEEKNEVLDILAISAIMVGGVICPHPVIKVALSLSGVALAVAHNRVDRVRCKDMEIEALKREIACIKAKQEGLPCEPSEVDTKNFPKTKPKVLADGYEFD